MPDWLYPLLRCPACGDTLVFRRIKVARDGLLEHTSGSCLERYPVIDGIPRMLLGQARHELVRARRDWFSANFETSSFLDEWAGAGRQDDVIAGFDDEWRRFSQVGTRDHEDMFAMYFDLIEPSHFAEDLIVLDAGCGAGRWAHEVSRKGPRVIAIDLGRSVEVARANTDPERVACLQADLQALPLAEKAADWAYSIGVLHHTREPDLALSEIVDVVRPQGLVLLYIYYALDGRGPLFRGLFRAVDVIRRVVSRQPRTLVRVIATVVATMVYWPLARFAALLEGTRAERFGASLPLAFYRHLSFETMLNDSIDRFGTRLERRYTRAQMTTLMEGAGLINVVLSSSWPYWHGLGMTAPRPDSSD